MVIKSNVLQESDNILFELLKKNGIIANSTMEIGRTIEENRKKTLLLVGMLKSVNSIANKTNLLAINASIETFHAAGLLNSFEDILAQNMLTQGKLISLALQLGMSFESEDCAEFAKKCGLEEIFITDGMGKILHTNVSGRKNMKLDTSNTYKVLENQEIDIVLPAISNDLEEMSFKIVGVARRDESGIIQLGCHYEKPKGQLAIDGFGVVAREAKRLADEARETARELTGLIAKLQSNMDNLSELSNEGQSVALEILQKVEKENTKAKSTKANQEYIESYEYKESVYESFDNGKVLFNNLENKLAEMKDSFKLIQNPLSLILKVAKQTNLLGVRASIEAAHSTNDKLDFDMLLNKQMLIQARLVAILLELSPEMNCDEIVEIASICGVDEFWISDKHGVVELTNIDGGKGFVYKNEGQTAPYMKILVDSSLEVTATPERRALDGKVFKYVAVGRKVGGFIQVGKASKIYGESTADGFSVVAKQIKSLAEQSKSITSDMVESLDTMYSTTDEANDIIRNSKKTLAESLILIKILFNLSRGNNGNDSGLL
ncbi:MAG: hypothetical protein WCF96_09650 [Eubacteriales bacterium]